MERPARVDQLGIEIRGAQARVRAGKVQERTLTVGSDQGHSRGRRCSRILHDGLPVDAPFLEHSEQHVSEWVDAHLAGRGCTEPQPGQRARGVERTAAAVDAHVLHECQCAPIGKLVDRPSDHVGDEDPEADDVGHAGRRTTCTSAGPCRPTIRRCSMSALRLGPDTIESEDGSGRSRLAKSVARSGRIRLSARSET